MQVPTVITLTGVAGSGKNTAGEILKKKFADAGKKYLLLSYADQLRSIVNANIDSSVKDRKLEYRKNMQYLGTEVVRLLEPDFWTHQTWHLIDLLSKTHTDDDYEDEDTQWKSEQDKQAILKIDSLKYDGFIITDARFENELSPSPYDLGYFIYNVKVERDDKLIKNRDYMTDKTKHHVSEEMAREKSNSEYFAVIWNNGTQKDLEQTCSELADTILKYNEVRNKAYFDKIKQIARENEIEFEQAGLNE